MTETRTEAGAGAIPEDLADIWYTARHSSLEHAFANLRVQQLIERIGLAERKFEEHTKHVSRFLTEMYQTMIDPLDDSGFKVAELCELLLHQAREDREKLNRSPANLPADWNQDSSLETWFPLTAEELKRKTERIATLTAQLHDAEAERDRMLEALEKAKIYAERRHRELWNPGNNFEPSASPAALAVAEDLAIIHAALAPEARAALSGGKP